MSNNYISLDNQEVSKNPFVFVSYCWEDPDIKERVSRLVISLRANGIPVIYDNGGLKPGENIREVQYLITHHNCKCVLVVNDSYYCKKAEEGKGGVGEEFHLILTDYPDNPMKYVVLNAGKILPLFKGVAYIHFKDDSHFEEIINGCSDKLNLNALGSDSIIAVYRQFLVADHLFDTEDYDAALKKINTAIKSSEVFKTIPTKTKLKMLHLKLIILIKVNMIDEAIKLVKDMQPRIPQNSDLHTKARYYGNFAIAYRKKKVDCPEFEKYAYEAYKYSKHMDKSTRENQIDKVYYARLYAEALFYSEQYCDSYVRVIEALKIFDELYPDVNECDIDVIKMYIELKCNIAETLVCCSKNKDRNTREEKLLKAEESVSDVSDKIKMISEEDLKCEAYRIFSLVYNKLYTHFKA